MTSPRRKRRITSARWRRTSAINKPCAAGPCRRSRRPRSPFWLPMMPVSSPGRSSTAAADNPSFPYTAGVLNVGDMHSEEKQLGKFTIQPHGRLQEWIAHEKGYFRDEGLDYEFVA